VRQAYPHDETKVMRMSLIEEGDDKKVRMAFLSILCSHTVNGVAALHSELLKKTIFKDFDEMFRGKIQNKTNGVTPRRWMVCCNKGLSKLVSDYLMDESEWVTNCTLLRDIA
jgi:starch phosphorylase